MIRDQFKKHGSVVGALITERLRQVENQQRELIDRLNVLEDLLRVATTNRETAYTRLAELYLPELGDEAVARVRDLVPELHYRFLEILDEKRGRRTSVEVQINDVQRQRTELHRSLETLTGQIDKKAEERDALAAAVQAELDKNGDYQRKLQEANQANERNLQAQRRLEAAIEERDGKTPAYEADVIFGYLLRRRYGSSDYRGTVLTRRLDDWVAGKVDYELQKENYDLLMEAPDVMETEFDKSEEILRADVADVEAIEQEAAERHGLTQVLADGESLYQERVVLVGRIEDLDSSFEDLVTEQKQLADSRGRYYEKVIEEYAEFLENKNIDSLKSLAHATETRSDDGLTEEIASLDDEIRQTQQDARETHRRRVSLAIKLKGLKDIQTRFYRKDYDASDSRFPSEYDAKELLDCYLNSDWTVEDVNRALDAQQRFLRDYPERRDSSGWEDALWDILCGDNRTGKGSSKKERSGGFGGWGGWIGGSSSAGGFGGGRSRSTGGFGGGRSRSTGGFGGGLSRTTGGFGGGRSRTTGGFG
ncbi:MAG: hypothetical protein JSU87_04950 [Gemmatimonadota bacterium]|nr:MAG: hypothetical protein JSU87_04950 [Gemmatimonadota bacterium]